MGGGGGASGRASDGGRAGGGRALTGRRSLGGPCTRFTPLLRGHNSPGPTNRARTCRCRFGHNRSPRGGRRLRGVERTPLSDPRVPGAARVGAALVPAWWRAPPPPPPPPPRPPGLQPRRPPCCWCQTSWAIGCAGGWRKAWPVGRQGAGGTPTPPQPAHGGPASPPTAPPLPPPRYPPHPPLHPQSRAASVLHTRHARARAQARKHAHELLAEWPPPPQRSGCRLLAPRRLVPLGLLLLLVLQAGLHALKERRGGGGAAAWLGP